MPVTSEIVELHVEKPAHGGRMLGRHEGQVVLVAGAIPGERVRAAVEREQRGVLFARTVQVIEPHPSRRPDNGDPACGGMTFSHIAYDAQCALKAEIVSDAFSRIARIPLERAIDVRASPELGYRLRARLHLRAGRLGSFREGTHEVCDVATTGQLLPSTIAVLREVEAVCGRVGVKDIQAIELMENLDASERVLHLVESPGTRLAAPVFAALAGIAGVTGLSRAGGFARISAVSGIPWVADPIARFVPATTRQASLRRHAPAFFQANRFLTGPLAQAVCATLDEGPVIDLYAGVGLFALCAAALGHRAVVAIEGDRVSADDLTRNARQFDSVRVLRQPVEEFLRSAVADRAATLIVDPPRTGMSRDALNGIVAFGARRIVYVSCDVATLARDVGRLMHAGYRLATLEAFDLFPNTPHVESLTVLQRD